MSLFETLLAAPAKDVMTSDSKRSKSSKAIPLADSFARRHIGPGSQEIAAMLGVLGCASLDEFIHQTVPADIRLARKLDLPEAKSEHETLKKLKVLLSRNRLFRTCIGMGYSDCITPPVIQRNILENPGWYTAYTPYQAEIAQGRLEALLNFQTMIADLTGMEIANASLLDEATAAAEAMTMCHAVRGGGNTIFVSTACHPQTIDVVRTRAEPLGIHVVADDHHAFHPDDSIFALFLQYPATDGRIEDYEALIAKADH